MELRVLNYFLIVAREENITKAANILHMTQPTLSRQLMQLEEELGIKLFERGRHRIVLTEDGLLLKRRAQEIVALVDKTRNEFYHEKEIAGEIAIGSGEMMSVCMLAELMGKFREQYPEVHFDVYSGNADEIKDRIENGLLDVGVLMEPVDIGRYSFARIPVQEEWGVMVLEDSPLAEKEVITPQDLVKYPVIISKRAIVQNEWFSWLGNEAEKLEIVSTFNLMYNAVMQLKKGLGILLCIRLDANYDGVKFIPISPALKLGTVLVWKKNQASTPVLAAFTQFCKEYLNG